MPTIARMYHSHETATAVAKELRDKGFSEDAIHVVAQPSPQPEGGGTDHVADSITQSGIAPAAAKIYAEGVGRGEALVVVNPPFGYARAATDIMDSHDPIAVDVPEPAPPKPTWLTYGLKTSSSTSPRTSSSTSPKTSSSTDWSGAAPLSAALGLPVLSSDPAPLSAALGMRVLSSDPAPLSSWFGWRTLKQEPRTSNTLEGIRKQSQDPAPLSSKLGMATLSSNAAPASGMFGWALLSDKPAPLSEKLGWRVLLSDPTPLSTALGWKTLSKGLTTVSDK